MRCWMRSKCCRAARCWLPNSSGRFCPARVRDYQPGDLDSLISSGNVVWVGKEQLGDRDGRIALYLAESLVEPACRRSRARGADRIYPQRARAILDMLARQGASFFNAIHEATGRGFPGDTLDALWELVWAGWITNDTLQPIRDLIQSRETQRARAMASDGRPGSPEFLRRFRARTGQHSPVQGRWSLVQQRTAIQR